MDKLENTKIQHIPERPALQYDGKLWISTGSSRFSKHWRNQERSWSAILSQLQKPTRTPETQAEYKKMSKAEQNQAKDHGGFVGGVLKDGKRGSHNVESRTILSYDLDNAPSSFYDDFKLDDGHASACYSTHKHSPKNPRFRLLVPLSRSVSADEYEAISRKFAEDAGFMEYLDPTTFQPSRLMYWPSCSTDAEYYFDYTDAPFLDPAEILDRYPDWKDPSEWPVSSKEKSARKTAAEKQADPRTKSGYIGAFCRAHTITDVIGTFLGDVYAATDHEDRYTYIPGSTTGGLVIYDGDLFAYSNHGTDPAGGQLCNAFDLVRIHLFGDQDANTTAETPPSKRPSYKAMMEFIQKDPETLREYDRAEEKTVTAADFDDDEEITPEEIKLKLDRTPGKGIQKSVKNAATVFRLDPNLQGIAYNRMSGMIEVLPEKPVPWSREPKPWGDTDDSQLYTYVALHYAEFRRQYVADQLAIKANNNAFNPVIDYLEGLPKWDGISRVDTLLIDYLGAEDNIFTREATAKALLAAVRRVYEPGCKFDNMLILSGGQGIGKSTLLDRLGGKFFNDNLTFDDMRSKEAAEKIQGSWILEIGELKGMRKMDVESVKAFISRREDKFRGAYGRHVQTLPRQCVIFGTVNNVSGYLKDVTGNRRFWPIELSGETDGRKPWDITEADRGQMWAEVLNRYRSGNKSLLLSPEAEKIAELKQTEALEHDDREGFVAEYLAEPLPDNWENMSIDARQSYLDGDDILEKTGEETHARKYVCSLEIWCECFRRRQSDMERRDSTAISGILLRLGWKRAGMRTINPYGRQRIFVPGEQKLQQSMQQSPERT